MIKNPTEKKKENSIPLPILHNTNPWLGCDISPVCHIISVRLKTDQY